jgi:hypothetical protein
VDTREQPEPDVPVDQEVWTDEPTTLSSGHRTGEPVIGSGTVIGTADARKHFNTMQTKVLWGIGIFFLITLATIVIAPATGKISEDLAKEIMHTVLPPVMASAATIVGTLFASGSDRRQ